MSLLLVSNLSLLLFLILKLPPEIKILDLFFPITLFNYCLLFYTSPVISVVYCKCTLV